MRRTSRRNHTPSGGIDIAEKQTLQFRMEMFNAPNHVELGVPSTGWGNSNVLPQATFGTITSTQASMRQIQFALKYNF